MPLRDRCHQGVHAIMEMEEHSLHKSEESEKQRWQKLYGDMTFVDDVHEGKLLKRDKVIEARKVEMYRRKFTRAKHVATKSSRLDAWTPTKEWEMKTIANQGWLDVSSTLTKDMTYSHQLHLQRR